MDPASFMGLHGSDSWHRPPRIRLPPWASKDPATSVGRFGSGYLSRPVGIRLLVPGLDIFHLDQQQLGRPMGHMPSPPSVGHPGLPESDHVDGIPMKYIHNSSPRSSPRFTVLPSSSACACIFILWLERIIENLEGLQTSYLQPSIGRKLHDPMVRFFGDSIQRSLHVIFGMDPTSQM